MIEELMKRTAAIIGQCIVITLVVLYLYVVGTFYLNHIFQVIRIAMVLGANCIIACHRAAFILYSPVDNWCDEHFTIRSSGGKGTRS